MKMMNPRLRIEFKGGSVTPLTSTVSQALGVWRRCVKHHGRSHLVPKHVEVCFYQRSNGCWRWIQLF